MNGNGQELKHSEFVKSLDQVTQLAVFETASEPQFMSMHWKKEVFVERMSSGTKGRRWNFVHIFGLDSENP